MKYIWLVGWRELAENARTKGFWIGILLFPVIITISVAVPVLLATKGVPTRHYVLIDQSGQFAPTIRAGMARNGSGRIDNARLEEIRRHTDDPVLAQVITNAAAAAPKAAWLEVPLPPGISSNLSPTALEAELRPWLRGDRFLPPSQASPKPKLFAAVIIPDHFGSTNSPAHPIRYWSVNQADTDLRDAIRRIVEEELHQRAYRSLGLDPDVLSRIANERAPLIDLNPSKAEGEERVGMADRLRQWLPSGFVYLLWIAIFMVSQMLLNSVIEEKSNRIIEVLLSSVTPSELMLGKLLGVMLTGAVIMVAWFASLIGVAFLQIVFSGAASAGAAASGLHSIPADILGLLRSTWLLPAFAVYFVLGYIAYATIFLTIGSLCNTLKDAQNLMGPIMLVLMVPLFLMPFIPRDPNGPIAQIASWIPLYTPFVMMNRIAASPPVFDVVGTGVVLVGFDVLVLWGCGRVFRTAILRTGQPPRIIELLRWIRDR